jgi:hypothetical protein
LDDESLITRKYKKPSLDSDENGRKQIYLADKRFRALYEDSLSESKGLALMQVPGARHE